MGDGSVPSTRAGTSGPTTTVTRSHRSVTLRAVAARAGVSKSVASRVLQGSPHVSDQRRLAVEAAIRELGYRPNATARSLTERRTRAVGVLMHDLRQPWFVDLLEGLDRSLGVDGLHPFVGDGQVNRTSDQRLLEAFMEMRVDGLVLAGTVPPSTTIAEAAAWLPTVVAGNRDFELPAVDVVAQDDALGAELALDHLAGLGHQRIAHIAGETGRVFEIRRATYLSWMRRHSLADHVAVAECDTTEEGGYRAGLRLLERDRLERPTAVFVANDLSCVGAMAAARDRGLDVPGDLSIVGFDNSVLARMRYIALTSVDIAPARVGELAGAALLERMAHPDMPARQQLVTPTLEVRCSTAAPTR